MPRPVRQADQSPTRFRKLDSYYSERLRTALAIFLEDMRVTWQSARTLELPILASSLAFFCLFSIFPFLILCFLGTRYVVGAHALPRREVAAFFETLVPNIAPWITGSLIEVIHRNVLDNLVSLVLLLTSAYGLFTCLHTIFARLSPGHEKRGLVASNLIALACFAVAAVSMTLLIIFFTTQPETLRLLFGHFLGGLSIANVGRVAQVIGVTAVLVTITLVYKLLPLQPVSWAAAFRGSVLFLSLFTVGRAGYETYVKCYALFNESTYGNFFALVIVFVWMYFLCTAFIFSAQYALCIKR